MKIKVTRKWDIKVTQRHDTVHDLNRVHLRDLCVSLVPCQGCVVRRAARKLRRIQHAMWLDAVRHATQVNGKAWR